MDAVGYVLVRGFRATLLELLFAPLAGQLEAQGHKLADLRLAPGCLAGPGPAPAGPIPLPKLCILAGTAASRRAAQP